MEDARHWAAWKAQGSRDALVALLEAHRSGVYAVCYQVLRHVQDAEDASQKVLLQLLDHLPELEDAEHLRRWLHRTGLHVCLKVLRSRRRRTEHEATKARQTASGTTPASSSEREALLERLASLDGEDQSLLIDHYFRRRSLPELARERKVSTVAVWKRLDRARNRLKAALTLSGLAAAVARMEAALEAVEIASPSAAPVPAGLVAKAAAVAGRGAGSAAAIGGLAMKGKSGAVAILIGLCAAGGVGLASWSRLTHREAVAVRVPDGRVPARMPEPAGALPGRDAAAGEAPAPQGPEVGSRRTFASIQAFVDAFLAACAIPDDPARWKALRDLGVGLPDEDFEQALAEARKRAARGYTTVGKSLPKTVLNAWPRRDPKGYFSLWLAIPDVREADKEEYWKDGVAGPFREWARQDPRTALDFIQGFPYSRAQEELAEMAWGMADPDTYLATVLRLPHDESRARKLAFAARALAGRDPSAAVARLSEVQDPEERRRATSEAFAEIARTDLDKAVLLSRDVPDAETRDLVAMSLTYSLMQKDAARAIALAESVVDAHRRDMLLGQILAHQARRDPGRVPELIRAYPASAVASCCADVAGAWAQADPRAALAWAQALPDSEATKVTVVGEDASYTMSTGEHAAAKAIDAWSEKDPRSALEWIQSSSIADDGRRRMRAAAVSRWARRDRPAAVRWISESALPSDEKDALRAALRR